MKDTINLTRRLIVSLDRANRQVILSYWRPGRMVGVALRATQWLPSFAAIAPSSYRVSVGPFVAFTVCLDYRRNYRLA